MITDTQAVYRTCRACKEAKPLDDLHFRVFSAANHRFATACRACEIALAAKRGETLPPMPIEPIIPRQEDQLPIGGKMHAYAGRAEVDEAINNNPTGRNGSTAENVLTGFQRRTWSLWMIAIEAVAARYGDDTEAYHHECDLLWAAIPRDDGWKSEGQHKGFHNFALGVIGGGK